MAQPAILVLLGVKPWSEDVAGIEVWRWWRANTQQQHLPDGLTWADAQLWEQQHEWVTATGSRSGVNALMKPHEALLEPQGPQASGAGVVRMVVRPATTTREGHVLKMASRKFACLWPGHCAIINPVSRTEPQRSPAHLLQVVIPDPAVRAAIFAALRAAVEIELAAVAAESTPTGQHKVLYNERNRLGTMNRLLQEAFKPRPEPAGAGGWSTKWTPGAGRRMQGPDDVLRAQCCCARLLKFPEWLHLNCNCGHLVLNRLTHFGPENVIPALLHFMKFELLSKCRVCPVEDASIIRGVVSSSQPDIIRVACTAADAALAGWEQRAEAAPQAWDATDKHKIVWVVPLFELTARRASWGSQGSGSTGSGSKGSGSKGSGKGAGKFKGKGKDSKGGLCPARPAADELPADASELWARGSLHIAVAAPRSRLGKWRITVAPDTTFAEQGRSCQVVLFILDWVGNKLFYHECLRRAANNPPALVPLQPLLFRQRPVGENGFRGRLPWAAVDQFQASLGIQLDDEQRAVINALNTESAATLFQIEALAGVGKSLVMQAILHCFVQTAGPKEAIVVLLPSRELREDMVKDVLSIPGFPQENLLWMGRPPSSGGVGLWDDLLAATVKEMQAPTHQKLADLQAGIRSHLASAAATVNLQGFSYFAQRFLPLCDATARLLSEGGQGPTLLTADMLRQAVPLPPGLQDEQRFIDDVVSAKAYLAHHVMLEVQDINGNYATLVETIGDPVRIVLSTADAWCKFTSKCMGGACAHVLKSKVIHVAVLDEGQAYDVDQACACLAKLRTAAVFGDQHQVLDQFQFPRYTRTPWVSADSDEGGQQEAELPSEEVDMDGADLAKSVEPAGTSFKNPDRRSLWDTLQVPHVFRLELNGCKRCGEVVCRFLRELMPNMCSRLHAAFRAPNTELVHMFYNSQWVPQQQGGSAPSAARSAGKRQGSMPVSLNKVLFAALARRVWSDLMGAAEKVRRTNCHDYPAVLIVCYLQRIASPLRVFLHDVFNSSPLQAMLRPLNVDAALKVVLLDSARGMTADYVHVIRSSRFVLPDGRNSNDQYHGIQGDLKREYISYTRGRLKTCVWLEELPHGSPGQKLELRGPSDAHWAGRKHALDRNDIIRKLELPHGVIREPDSDKWADHVDDGPGVPKQQLILGIDLALGWNAASLAAAAAKEGGKVVTAAYASPDAALNAMLDPNSQLRTKFLDMELDTAWGIGVAQGVAPMELPDKDLQHDYPFSEAAKLAMSMATLTANVAGSSQMVQLSIPMIRCVGLDSLGSTSGPETMLRSFVRVVCKLYIVVYRDELTRSQGHAAQGRDVRGVWPPLVLRAMRVRP